MKKLLPIILALVGIGAGVGAGIALKPAPVEDMAADPCGDAQDASQIAEVEPDPVPEEDSELEYAELSNQLVVPVVRDDLVNSIIVMSLSIEVPTGLAAEVYNREPKLRDAFLQVLFDHANMGGFNGNFTSASNMASLRKSLTLVAKKTLPGVAKDVLISDILRQDN